MVQVLYVLNKANSFTSESGLSNLYNVPICLQDAKSDRVKQLLKETEKYLQKLGSKLKDAKSMARQFETDMEESTVEENEDAVENEDEKDQAKVSKLLFYFTAVTL